MDVKGKLALVTGGTDGIGRALVERMAEAGAQVISVGRNPVRLAELSARGIDTVAADLSTPAGIDAVVAAVGERPLALLINNAGVGADHDVLGTVDLASADSAIALNLTAPIHLGVRLLPLLRAQPTAKIVNVTSGLAIAPRAGGPVYCATKAALRSYTMALRHQLRDTAVSVLEVLPPVVDTRMTAGRTGAKMSAAACADAIMVAIASDSDEANVGAVKWLRLVYSLSPALARRIMIRF